MLIPNLPTSLVDLSRRNRSLAQAVGKNRNVGAVWAWVWRLVFSDRLCSELFGGVPC
jgi:hypothetical protein